MSQIIICADGATLRKSVMVKTLRPYQDAALKSLWKYIYANPKKHPLVVAPVAAGKSLLIAEFIKQVHDQFPRTRIVVLTHVKELLLQNAEELEQQYFGCDFGFYCAGLNQKRLNNDITFASIQSVNKKIDDFNRVPEIILIDECHLISHKATTQYRKFIDDVLERNPNCKVIGFTGTPFRADTGRLDEGENKLFDGIAYEIGMDFMIEEGYWAKPVCPQVATKMDVSGVESRGGDYVEKQLQEAVNTKDINDACVKELATVGANRNKWLIFTAGVEHAENFCAELNAAGIEARYIHSKKPKAENDQDLKDHKAGKYKALVNVAKLTTGYNDPEIDLLCFARPTRSPVLYIQTVGRGVRTNYADGYDLTTKQGRLDAIANSNKPDCMIVDFGGVVEELGAIDTVSIKKSYMGEKEEGEKGEAITKICPSCGTECAAAQRYCYSCSYCFINLAEEAAQNAIVSRDEPAQWLNVLSSYNQLHKKDGGQDSMKVTYATMTGAIREWVCFEHHIFPPEDNKRFAWNKAVAWHKARREDLPCPQAVPDALEIEYPTPKRILAQKKGKYWSVLDHEFETETIKEEEFFDIPF